MIDYGADRYCSGYLVGFGSAAMIILYAFVLFIRWKPLKARVYFERLVNYYSSSAPASKNFAIKRPFHTKDGRILPNYTPVVFRDVATGIMHKAVTSGYETSINGAFYTVESRAYGSSWVRDIDVWEPEEVPAKMIGY
jgi:hypothetical protein